MAKGFKKGLLFGGLLGSIATYFAMSDKTKAQRERLKADLDKMLEAIKLKAESMEDFSEEAYRALVSKLADEYAEKKDLAIESKDRLVTELRKRWLEVQAYFLYLKVRTRLRKLGEVTRDKFNDTVDDLVDELAEKREITREAERRISRSLKDRWNDFKEELNKGLD